MQKAAHKQGDQKHGKNRPIFWKVAKNSYQAK